MQIQTDFSCGLISRGPWSDLWTMRMTQWLKSKKSNKSSDNRPGAAWVKGIPHAQNFPGLNYTGSTVDCGWILPISASISARQIPATIEARWRASSASAVWPLWSPAIAIFKWRTSE